VAKQFHVVEEIDDDTFKIIARNVRANDRDQAVKQMAKGSGWYRAIPVFWWPDAVEIEDEVIHRRSIAGRKP
jgi:hypothetical protein